MSRCSGNKPVLLPQRYMRVGHFNSFLARGGDLNKNFPKIQMHEGCLERGGGGDVKDSIWLVHKADLSEMIFIKKWESETEEL